MQQLKEWGFSANWWRGERGEYWVIMQVVLFIGFSILPVYPFTSKTNVLPVWHYVSDALAVLFGLFSLVILTLGLKDLGNNLTPLPHPKDSGKLVTSGVYGLVRHPIYSGVIFLAIAYTIWQWSLTHGIGVLVLILFFDIKGRKEEAWLRDKFPEYDVYQSNVSKLIPWIY
jgi:protein-S-isoprenylcysteine O-methyltransferase Ste14